MEDFEKIWSKLDDRFYNEILKKYSIDLDKVTDEKEQIGDNIINIQARFDGERLFDTEEEDLKDLKLQIEWLEEDLKKIYKQEQDFEIFLKNLYFNPIEELYYEK